MSDISFEKIDSAGSGRQDTAYAASVCMLLCGALVLFTATGTAALLGGAALIVAAILGYVRLVTDKRSLALRDSLGIWSPRLESTNLSDCA
ncbi:hypothetical protein ASF77_18620 [Massilia sp. Leaf139]|nr:hypothetical protein ASF77_18620 [Massilia sp. Leaf139]